MRLLAVALGLVAGLIVLAAFASRIGLIGSPAPAAVTASASGTTAPTRVAAARQLSSLAEFSRATDLRSGQEIEIRLDEASLNRDVTTYLQSSAPDVTVTNTQVRLTPGLVVFTGSLRQGVLATGFTLTSYPSARNGQLVLVIQSLEPALVSQFSPVKPGQTIDLAPALQPRSVTVVDGLMVVVGFVR